MAELVYVSYLNTSWFYVTMHFKSEKPYLFWFEYFIFAQQIQKDKDICIRQ